MKPYLHMLSLSGLLAAAVAGAQTLPDTVPATKTRTTNRVEPTPAPVAPPRREAAPATMPRSLSTPKPTTLEQRPQLAAPVRGTAGEQAPTQTTPRVNAQDKVYDRDGRLLPGVRPAGPNRVFDTRTGRYYDSVPSNGGQRIVR